MGCAFWGSDECAPCVPCLFFSFIFNQAACLLLHPTKPYRGVNFPYQHFLEAAYWMPRNYLRRLDYATVRPPTVRRYQYSTIGNKVMPICNSTYYRSIERDHDDHAPFMIAVFVTTYPQVGTLI